MIASLKEKNKNLKLFDIDSAELREYGRKVTGISFEEMISDANKMEIPDGVKYEAANEILEKDSKKITEIENLVFGQMPVQIGICWGKSSKLNGLEWHKGSELIVSATESVLLLAKYSDFEEKDGKLSLDTKKVVGLYLKKNDAVELYPMILHLAPCQVNDDGFRDIIILPKGTNEKLDGPSDDVLLLAKNKWLVGHPEMQYKHTALHGDNIELKY